ncbi:MAG: hypothetical protein JWP76_5911 [Dactylosporangium sp.]|jgi:hypothetical protein|nr:hypothetical protein [Dactylosporangium sp.]
MVIVAAAFVAGPALGGAPAYAKDGQEKGYASGQTVSFTGGSVLSMLVCRSEPSEDRLTIPAESRVMFVNRLGQNATLRVNGQALVQVGPNQAAPVVFHYGPVSVSMSFSCGAGVLQQFSSVSVSVTGAGPQAPHRSPTPPPPVPSTTVPAAGATPSSTAKARSGSSGHAALSQARPSPGLSVTAATTSPAPAQSAAAVHPSTSGAPAGSGKPGNPVAVEPIVLASDAPRENLSVLLALIAAVCAVGVTIAVTRVIISKRTIRTRCA